jgi:sugar phosphate permease
VKYGDELMSAPISIESTTIWKLRIRLLPFLLLLYVVAFVDRINIGFAALTMNRELAITSQQFGFAAGIFFFGYFFFEVPSNVLTHRIGARVWMARILITWGIVAVLPTASCRLPALPRALPQLSRRSSSHCYAHDSHPHARCP